MRKPILEGLKLSKPSARQAASAVPSGSRLITFLMESKSWKPVFVKTSDPSGEGTLIQGSSREAAIDTAIRGMIRAGLVRIAFCFMLILIETPPHGGWSLTG